MRRREFIGLVFLTATGGAALAEPSGRISRVAVLMPNVSSISRGAFDRALRDLGWIDGRNVQIE